MSWSPGGPSPPAPVVFNYETWVQQFPTFAAVTPLQAQTYFDLAELYYSNWGWTAAIPKAATFLNLLTCHIAWLLSPRDSNGNPSATGQPASPLVGRVSNASEGSVSVAVELIPSGSPSESFFSQSTWGLMFWAGTAPYRTAHFVPAPRRGPNSPFAPPYYGPFGWSR